MRRCRRFLIGYVCSGLIAATACARAPRSPAGLAGEPGVAARAPVPGAPSGITAFVNVAVIPMDTERVLPSQTVLIEQGWITAVGPAGQVKVPAGATRIDGQGKYLLPGLADMHAHVVIFDDVSEAERRLRLYALNGVTTVRNVDYASPDDGEIALQLRTRAAAGTLLSPRLYTSGRLPHTKREELGKIAEQVAAYQAAGYDFIKVHDQKRTEIDSIAAAARRLGLPMIGHVPDDADLSWALAKGYASLEHLSVYLAYLAEGREGPRRSVQGGNWTGWKRLRSSSDPATVDAAQRAILQQQLDMTKIPTAAAATQRAGLWICPTLALAEVKADAGVAEQWPEARYMAARVHRGWAQTQREPMGTIDGSLAARRQLVAAFQAAGVGLLLGTDAPVLYMTPGFTVHRELEALVRAGLTPYQALATGTRNVASFLGTLNETGTVTVGKRADLVLLAADPLREIRNTRRIAGVMLGGRWLPQEELDRRLAVEERRVGYEDDAKLQLETLSLVALQHLWNFSPRPALQRLVKLPLTDAQQAALQRLGAAHDVRERALIDSLSATEPGKAGRERLLALIGRAAPRRGPGGADAGAAGGVRRASQRVAAGVRQGRLSGADSWRPAPALRARVRYVA
jgi:imidazolonepropionase-like amidohydrolase